MGVQQNSHIPGGEADQSWCQKWDLLEQPRLIETCGLRRERMKCQFTRDFRFVGGRVVTMVWSSSWAVIGYRGGSCRWDSELDELPGVGLLGA